MPQRPAPPWMHAHHWGHAWWAGGFLSLLSTLAELALLVGLIWLALRWLLPYLRPRINAIFGLFPAMPSAFEILRQRYAAGEIDAWTFEHMWERLQASYQQEPVSALADARFDRREAARQRAAHSAPGAGTPASASRTARKAAINCERAPSGPFTASGQARLSIIGGFAGVWRKELPGRGP